MPPVIANKIAAGEVIERPASVVKELVENAIDARAQHIIVDIEDGGKSLVKIIDDGIGMSKEDLNLCVERHATSKLKDIDDIEKITTLGFRGEALPSIASVSETIIKTRQKDFDSGWQLKVISGDKSDIMPVSCNFGTIIEVRELFFNLPARKKFLKSSQWEFQYISNLVKLFAVSHHNLSFELNKLGKRVFSSFAKKWGKEVLLPLFDAESLEKFIVYENKINDVKIKIIISDASKAAINSKNFYFFLNNRHISGKMLWKAVSDACQGIYMKSMCPQGIIFIDLPPEYVDVNVHPTKMEARFHNSLDIFRIIYNSVKNALLSPKQSYFNNLTGSVNLSSKNFIEIKDKENLFACQIDTETEIKNDKNLWTMVLDEIYRDEKSPEHEIDSSEPEIFNDYSAEQKPSSPFNDVIIAEKNNQEIRIMGQLFNSYIIAQSPVGLYLIDQHALHEALIHKSLLEYYEKDRDYPGQLLLFPVIIDISTEQMERFIKTQNLLQKLGLSLEIFGEKQLIIRGVPQIPILRQKEISVENFISKILDSNLEDRAFFLHNAISFISCDMSVKSGKSLSNAEMNWLLAEMLKKKITNCPHGRPVMICMDKKEILTRFGRK